MAGFLAQAMAKVLMVVVLFKMKARNEEDVMIRYKESVRRVRVGENCSTIIIHPKWAIDE